ncbi:MAG: AAA family ATPase [Rhizobiales bacterium]|nr:AAA family ATPase [Hyphomicrobiales bacterium]OJY44906.1 MAG: exopolysaccharide biosynthesis protein [Rhizobiales bacterium 64-17]
MLRRVTDDRLEPQAYYESTVSPKTAAWDGISVSEIVRILRRRVAVIGFTVAVFVVAAVLVIILVKPTYTATSTVLIDPRRPNVVNLDSKNQPAIQSPQTDDAAIESQVLLAQSIAVLRRVVESMKLTDDPEFTPKPGIMGSLLALLPATRRPVGDTQDVKTKSAVAILQNKLKVVRQKNTFLVDINVGLHDPYRAAEISNAIANAYFEELIRSKSDANKSAAGWLNEQMSELKSRVEASDRAVEQYRGEHNLTLAKGETINSQQVSDLNSKLVQARADAAEARAKYDQVAEIARNKADPGSLTEALSSDTIARLRGQYAQLRVNESDLSSRYGAHHPQVAAVRAQLRDTQKLITDEVARILQSRRHGYEVAAAREQSLSNSLKSLQEVSSTSGQAEVRLRELQREADADRSLYEAFLGNYKEATARESFQLPEARIVSLATAPIQPSFPKPLLFLGIFIPLGVAFGSLIAIGIDRFDRRVKTLDQVEAISGMVGIATLPLIGLRELSHMAKRGKSALSEYQAQAPQILPLALQPPLMRYIAEEPNSVFAEAIRAVRLSVQRAAHARRMQVIMLTSAIDGEGKTTLAANLALSYAMMGVRTLLIEGDMRNPEVSRSLCPHAEVGLFDVARGEASLQQAVLMEKTTGLSVLPSPLSEDSAVMTEFAYSEAMNIIVSELRRHFDMIIVDSPPLVPLVESRALSEHADGIVLAVGWDRTPEDLVVRAVDLLSPVRDRILGAVLTSADLRRLRGYDYYQSTAYVKPYHPGRAKQVAES